MKKLLLLLILVVVNIRATETKRFIVEFYEEPLSLAFGNNLKSANAKLLKSKIQNEHNYFLTKLSKQFKQKSFSTQHQYYYAFNGMSVSLDKEQYDWIRHQTEVKSVQVETHYNLHTDIGPQWIGAANVWEGLAPDYPGNKGEGVVVGIIDTGINSSHPSFAQVSQAGTAQEYMHSNPRGTTFGLCTVQTCNNKLIGIYDFTDEETNGIDSQGHGSHVASTAAGNVYITNYLGLDFTVSGVAPRANIISYKACFVNDDGQGRCASGDLMAAIDQATSNLVDVVNYSIGSKTPCSPWAGLDNNGAFCGNFGAGHDAVAMLNARNAGVLFVVSAGNNGPGASTVGYPAVAPWVIAAANTTHSRQLQSSVVDFTGGNTELEDLVGESATGGVGPLRIVHAKDFGNALCGQGDPELKSECSGTGNNVLTGITNPFAANTFNGEIVVCDRGSYGRVEKGFNVLQSGAAGYILANTVGQQESIAADSHCLPATHLGNKDGSKLREWLDSGSNHMGTITGQTLVYDDVLGDVLNSSSSRGPTEIIYNSTSSTALTRHAQNYMKPNLSAPGTSIIAAGQTGSGLTTKSGTSMASPHIAGAVALIKSAHPDYSPSQIISSLVLTADNSQMLKEDKTTKADFADQGAGRTRVDRAITNSLYFDISRSQFINANPQDGADISQLNLPELVNDNCYPSCSFTRKVKLLNSFNVVNPVWDVTTEQTNGLNITVTPDSFDFSSATEVTLNIEIDTTANDVIGDWAEAKILFTVNSSTNSDPMLDSASPSVSKLPLAVYVPAGNYPEMVETQSTTRHGRFRIDLNNIAAMTDTTYTGLGLLVPQVETYNLTADSNNSPFDSDGIYEEAGSSFSLFEINSQKLAAIIEITSTGSNGADLYIGQDLNINSTPDEFEVLCKQKNTVTNKRCVLKDLKPGSYWLLVNNPSSNFTSSITTELSLFDEDDVAQKAGFELGIGLKEGRGMYVTAPVQVQTNTKLEVIYELPAKASPSNHYYGIIAVGADSESVGKTAIVPVKLTANNPTSDKLYSLNNEVAEFNYTEGQVLSDMYVDTGIGATKIVLSGYEIPYNVNIYQLPLEFDPLNIKPDLTGLSPDFSALSSGSIVGVTPPGFIDVQTVEFNMSDFEPSRWYIEVAPSFPNNYLAGYFAIRAKVQYSVEDLIQPNQSLWYNPARSGWGLDLIQAQSVQAVTWYRYNQDGTKPTWMQSVGSITNQNQWRGDLKNYVWNGSKTKQQLFGSISMVYTSESEGVVSISMPDKTYSESIVSLYSPANDCPEINDAEQLDITGLWYLPEQSGFGNTVLATEANEFTVFYFYDDLGLPTWVIGDRELDDSKTLMKQTSNGFCPDCEFSEISKQVVGTIVNQYTNDSTGSTTADIQLLTPMSGNWHSTGNSKKLNTNFGCRINE